MGYGLIGISEDESELCMIIIPCINTNTGIYQWQLEKNHIFTNENELIFP